MLSPRWRKLGRDLWMDKDSALLMVTAITVSLVAVGAVLGAYSILTREIAVNYLGTRPASATLELEGGVPPQVVGEARHYPGIVEAEARDVVPARVRVAADWLPMLLFAVDDFADLRLNTFRRESGAWPPPEGTMLIERSAVSVIQAAPGRSVLVKTPNGAPQEVPITGLVHDPGLAPAWQEREGYGYVTRATLARLGEAPLLRELRIAVRGRPLDAGTIEAEAAGLAKWLGGQGYPVHQIRVPPPGQHPHQKQMKTILLLLLAFAVMALVLSGVLVATSLAAMLARQVREIGVMKTVGARTGQIAGLYAAMVAGLGAVSVLLAWPAGAAGARRFARAISSMLNFDLTSSAIPGWVFAVVAAAGVLVPILVALVPIGRASAVTVRRAIDEHGVSADRIRPGLSALPPALRNAFRRPARLALTVGLLATGGAMFMTALNVSRGWERNLAKIGETRFYDVEVRFHRPEPIALAERLSRLPGVKKAEAWGYTPAAFARPGRIDVVRTYPDRGHGSMAVLAPPPGTGLVRFPLRAGRWLAPGDSDAVVLNHAAMAQAKGARIGDRLTLSLDGQQTTWRLAGVVEEIGSMGVAYVTDEAFARAAGAAGGARMLRIATTSGSAAARTGVIRSIERALAEEGVGVETAIPLAELKTAVGEHVSMLIGALIAMAVILGIVGMLGLGSTMGITVLERTRELGVMRTIGATPGRIARMIVEEALAIGGMSWVLALGMAFPLTWLVDFLVGNLGFLAPLPFVMSPWPALVWLAAAGLVSAAATLLPAHRASRLVVREALAHP